MYFPPEVRGAKHFPTTIAENLKEVVNWTKMVNQITDLQKSWISLIIIKILNLVIVSAASSMKP